MSVWLVIALFAVAMVAFFSSLFALFVTRVPVLRTPAALLPAIRQAIRLSDDQILVDLGCADARTLLALCAGSKVRARGYELNGPVWLVGWLRVLLSGNAGRIRVCWKDFFRCELEDVDTVFCYLMPAMMERVARKCTEEMRPGSRLVSFLWPVSGWEPEASHRLGRSNDPLYVYRISPDQQTPDRPQLPAKNLTGSGPADILKGKPSGVKRR